LHALYSVKVLFYYVRTTHGQRGGAARVRVQVYMARIRILYNARGIYYLLYCCSDVFFFRFVFSRTTRARAGGQNFLKTIFFWWEIFGRKARARRCFGRQKDGTHNGRTILPRRLHVRWRAAHCPHNLTWRTRRIRVRVWVCAWVCVPPKTCPLHVREQWTTWRWRRRSRRNVVLYNTQKSRSLVLRELQILQ